MKTKRLLSLTLGFAVASLLSTASAQAATIVQLITTFDYPGVNLTFPFAINDSNETAGVREVSSARNSGFTRMANGQFSTPIHYPNDGISGTSVFGLNNSGTLSGFFVGGSDDKYHGFFLSGGVYTQYDIPGTNGTLPHGINDAGDFVGYFYDATNMLQGFSNIGGTVTQINIPGGAFVNVNQLNSANQLVGFYNAAGIVHGFYSDISGALHFPIDVPAATDTSLWGINDRGWMVGQYHTLNGRTLTGHGLFFIPPSQFVTYDYPGATATVLTGINRKGVICGYYTDAFHHNHGLLARVTRSAGSD